MVWRVICPLPGSIRIHKEMLMEAARTLEQFPLQGLSRMTSYESYLVQVHFELAVGKMLEITSILTPYSRNWRMGKIWKNTVNQQLPWFGVLGFSC